MVADQYLGLHHFQHRVFRPFPSQARILDAAVRHMIGTETRHFVHQDAADIQMLKSVADSPAVEGEYARLQTEVRGIDRVDRDLEIGKGFDYYNRRERLLCVDFHAAMDAGQYGRRV
jgi:hypothetical protein